MPYRERRIYSGALLEIERKHCTHCGREIGRSGKALRTGEAQKKLNLAYARRHLMRMLCANFTRGDLYITLTFAELPAGADQDAELARFLRRLRTSCRKKTGQDLRYICVKEDRKVRPHYHLVCQALSITPAELQAMWGCGRVEIGTLDGSPDYGWLARYLTKQEDREAYKRRFSQSKNLEKPLETMPRILKRKELQRRPAVPAGYYVLASYRYATSGGYEGEYIVAIREDRKQELPEEIAEQLGTSATWGDWIDIGEV